MFIRKDVALAGILLCVGVAVSKQAEAKGFADDVREWNLLRFEQEKIKTQMKALRIEFGWSCFSEDHISQKEIKFLDKLHTPNILCECTEATQVVGLASSLIRLGKYKVDLQNWQRMTCVLNLFLQRISKISKILMTPNWQQIWNFFYK